MHQITGDRKAVEELLEDTVKHFKQVQPKKPGSRAMSASAKKGAAPTNEAGVWARGLEEIKKDSGAGGARAAGTEQKPRKPMGERAVDTSYAPRDQFIALFQSAMDEYLDESVGPAKGDVSQKASKKTSAASAAKSTKAAKAKAASIDDFYAGAAKKPTKPGKTTRGANILIELGNLDPRWVTVATEKARSWLKGKHKFPTHKSTTDFRFQMNNETTVAVVGDWGGGNAAAQAVAKQIAKLKPNHVIHLGDVYYAGTPKEVQERFLKYWPMPASPGTSFALNSNHEMYSGGYGYFDHILTQFKQPASYFSLANDNWRFIGLDTGYDEHDLHGRQVEWLKAQLTPGPKTILLSHHQLFSAYENTDSSKLRNKIQPMLGNVFGWVWGHEHLAVVYQQNEGINAICLGNGCFPYNLPKNKEKIPIRWIDKRKSTDPDYAGGHTFALFKIKGPQIDIDFIDYQGNVGYTEVWK
jgi:predicted phosphodiesterase